MKFILNEQLPIHTQLVGEIIRRVVVGDYPPSSKLPSVREFAMEFQVNPNTMQKALTELETLNIIYTQRTNGKFVTDDATLIQNLRQEQCEKITSNFFEDMLALGLSKEEIEKFAKNYFKNKQGEQK